MNSRWLGPTGSVGTGVAVRGGVHSGLPKARTRAEGFTLLELLIAIAVMGAMGLAAAPGIISFRADQRQGFAATELRDFANKMRTYALTRRRAVRLSFDPLGGNGFGGVDAVELMGDYCWLAAANNPPSCLSGNWGVPGPWPLACSGPPGPDLGNFSMQEFNGARTLAEDQHAISMVSPPIQLCYQPNHQILSFVGGMWLEPVNPLFVRIARSHLGAPVGVQRVVEFPPGGPALVRQ